MGGKSKAEVLVVGASTVHAWLADDQAVLVDVRETSEYDQEHIPGAMLLPMSAFDPELFPTVPDKKVVLHCAVGKRSEAAGKMLLREGYEGVIHMAGGIQAWKEAGFATEVQFTPHPGPQDIVPPGETREAPAQTASEVLCPPPGEVLVEEFLKPLGIDRAELAEAIGVSHDAVEAIVEAKSAMTAETSLRLARYFSTAADFWLHLQIEHDLEEARRSVGKQIQRSVTPRTTIK
jgi:addiction module HigA family antidote